MEHLQNYLGFKPDSDEWKVMALSSYSKKQNIYDLKINKLFELNPQGFELDLRLFQLLHF